MEKLWKSYGISFLGICTNPVKLTLPKDCRFQLELENVIKNVEIMNSVSCAVETHRRFHRHDQEF